MISLEALAQEAYEAHRDAMSPCLMLSWAYLDARTRAAWVEAARRVVLRVNELH